MTTQIGSETDLRTSGSEEKQKDWERKWWHSNPFARKNVRQTLLDMTLHGVPHMVEQERVPWSRLLWVLGVFSSLGLFLTMFYWLQLDYYNYSFKTVLSSTPIERLPFPSVSICNINTLDVSHVAYAHTLRDIMSWTAFGSIYLQNKNVTAHHRQLFNMSAQKILEDTNPGIKNSLKACFYDNVNYACEELFYTTHWALTRCFTLDAAKLQPASATTTLRVIININQDGYVVQEDKSVGIKFFIHQADDAPNLNAHTTTASPGFSTHVALQHQQMDMLPFPYKSYGAQYCIKTEDVDTSKLPVMGQYRLMPCLKARALQRAHSHCSCRTPFAPATEQNLPDCTLYQMLICVMPILDRLIRENRYNASEELDCPLPCDFVQFIPSITFSYFPSRQVQKMYYFMELLNSTDIRDNYLEMNFHYAELVLRKVQFVPEYTAMSIMGNIGGNMGFFLGASVVTLGELTELLIIMLFRLFRWMCAAISRTRPGTRKP